MICLNCSTDNKENSLFCKNCGTRLFVPIYQPLPSPKKTFSMLKLGAILNLPGACIFLLIIFDEGITRIKLIIENPTIENLSYLLFCITPIIIGVTSAFFIKKAKRDA